MGRRKEEIDTSNDDKYSSFPENMAEEARKADRDIASSAKRGSSNSDAGADFPLD